MRRVVLALVLAVPLVVLALSQGRDSEAGPAASPVSPEAAEATAATLPEYWTAPDFSLIDQAGAAVDDDDLRGTVWVASFVFTHCTDVCPAISGRMARLAAELRREGVLGDAVRLVSFTVDPERDSPEVLAAYARGFGGLPPAEWAFLTGTPGDSMRTMIQEGFRLATMRPEQPEHREHEARRAEAEGEDHPDHGATPDYQVMHSPRVLLVDAAGMVRGIYDALDAASMERASADALRLASAAGTT